MCATEAKVQPSDNLKKKQVFHGDSTLTAATEASSVVEDDTHTNLNDSPSKQSHHHNNKNPFTIPYTIALPLLVMLDMMGVSLVVPLLSSRYYALAGVTSAVQREWLSSIFSASQIVGGLFIGALADSHLLTRHTILLLSFVGSAVAYALIALPAGGLTAIVISRVLVGLVKQTMTVTSSILAHSTHENERAVHMGRLTASVTVAWIVGPTVGAYLYSHVGVYAPIYCSCGLFLINSGIVLCCLPKEEKDEHEEEKETKQQNQQSTTAVQRILSNFQACFQSNNPCLTSTVSALLLFQWVSRTTSYKNISTYYEVHYGIEAHQRGYLQSYQSALAFLVQSTLIQPILHHAGGEVRAACAASLLMAIVTFAELQVSFQQYLAIVCPLMGIAVAILGVSLKSILSKVAPKKSLSSVFATLDVLQNVAMVTVPFYRTLLFRVTQPETMESTVLGDPDPSQWLWASGVHWMLATVAFSYLLLQGNPCANNVGNNKEDESKEEKVKTN